MIIKEMIDGFEQYTLSCGELSVSVVTYGATVTHLKRGEEELVLHYDSPEGFKTGFGYINAVVGRYANRIGGGKVTINGEELQLACNERGNQLHGGPDAFDRQIWTVEEAADDRLILSLCSPDGENGYPGNLKATVVYALDAEGMTMDFYGISDRDTIFAPTTHMYFSLCESCLNTKLRMNTPTYLEVDEALLPTTAVKAEGQWDFTSLRPIARNFDHCFVAEGGKSHALLVGDRTAIELTTDYPALQLYTAPFMAPPFHANAGSALEPEYLPDSPNHPEFPSPLLRAGEQYHKTIRYRIFDASEVKA